MAGTLEIFLLSFAIAKRFQILNKQKDVVEQSKLEFELLYEKAQTQKQRMQLERIQRIIQPHFLLNSINVAMYILHKDPDKANEIVCSLADEFRILEKIAKEEYVTVEQEIELCQTHICNMQSLKKIKYEMEVHLTNEKQKIPPLILHTLIENSIKYTKDNNDVVKINISQIKEQDEYKFIIDTKANIKKEINPEGTGTKYIKACLEEKYGKNWQFSQYPTQDGWQVKIEVPILATDSAS